ncbi:DNA cytosine methyltransferase [Glaciecola sp. 2405UD65-10]|uniref:DNA cytosine methyltransferase n=1 Tax=Glaciecola sp. 2405UD65-10 TaxID=3397244 RepID=UPI003B5C3538
MNILSLFDGMSCGQIAINKIGIKPTAYYAAEIDKHAIQVTQANYPNTIQLGDVTKWRDWDINWSSIDLVTGGFPCQAWSMAGKQLGDKDERGMLFWVMLDIMSHAKKSNPKIKFLIENVKMKKEFEEYITFHTEQALGEVNKVPINSALVSAQNRNRFYWCNWHVEQPEDKGIVLADILGLGHVDRDKSHCLDASYYKGGNLKSYFEKNRRQLVFLNEIKDSYRKLTPIECERLQTVPDNYTNHVSNTQRYKMLGNGWTVDAIAHIYSQMELPIQVFVRQLDMFGDAA